MKAELILRDCWGPEKKSVGLRYIGQAARKRLRHVFVDPDIMFDMLDIAADMKEYKFGYVDDVWIDNPTLLKPSRHVLPLTVVTDNIPNCLWHADNLRVLMGDETERVFDPSAVTFLYPSYLSELTTKETGFAHPQVIADGYNSENSLDAKGDVVSLREIAEDAARGMNDMDPSDPEWQRRYDNIEKLLEKTYTHAAQLFAKDGTVGVHWLPHARKRLMLFSNSLAHSNDLVKQKGKPRSNTIWRRMLPGKKFMTFNTSPFDER